jgi:curved DNA-binding protein
MNAVNHYATLSIDPCASGAEIKRAYRVLARRFHPDVSLDRDGESKFKAVSEAYRTLKLQATRDAYDRRIQNVCAGSGEALTGPGIFSGGLYFLSCWIWFFSMCRGDPR